MLRLTGSFRTLEKMFVVVALLLFTGAFLVLFGGGEEGNNRLAQASYLGIYGITCLFVAAQLKRFIYVSTREPLLLLLVGLACLSVLWSVAPEVTLRRSFALLGTTIFGAYLTMRFSLREQLQLLAWALGIAALLSLVFALALPGYGVISDARGEAFRGIYHQKNVLGRIMALSALVFIFVTFGDRKHFWFKWGGFGLSFGLLLLSYGKTGLVVLLIVLVLTLAYRALRQTYTIAVPALIAVVLVGASVFVWLLGNMESALAVLDRDVTLTGRTELWPAVLEMIAKRPWLGYGYSAFWMGWEGESAYVWIWLAALANNFYPTHAHNGVLELWLDLGFLGVLVFGLVLLRAFGRAIRLIRSTDAMEGIWPLTYLTFMSLVGITYPISLERNSIWWVLCVTIVVNLAAQPDRIGNNRLYGAKGVSKKKYWNKDG
jgi:exopolysaccharide production protein ExoQ